MDDAPNQRTAESSRADRPQRAVAAVFEEAGKPLVLREFPIPVPAESETLVRVDLCTICGSDLHTVTGKRTEPTPSILAHEIVGTVVEVGDPAPSDIDGRPICAGDRVTWGVCVSCFACDRCKSGFPQKCRQITKYGHSTASGHGALSGGMSEWIVLRKGSAIGKLGPDLPDRVASPINCATSTIAAAFRVAGDTSGKRVLIVGAGMLGLTAAAFADREDASRITVCDIDPDRCQLALRFGADQAVDFHTLGALDERFDVIIECSGSPDAIESVLELADIGAHLVWVGSVMNSRPVSIDPSRVVRHWLSIHGVHNYAPVDLRRAIDFVRLHHRDYPFAELVERVFPLNEINDAIDYAIQERPVRVAIRP